MRTIPEFIADIRSVEADPNSSILRLCDAYDQQGKEIADLRAANLAISETHHRLSFDAREAEARRADAEAERDRLKADLEILLRCARHQGI